MNCPKHDCPQDIHCPCDDKIEQDRLRSDVTSVYVFPNGHVCAFRGDAQTPDLQRENIVLNWARHAISKGYEVHGAAVHLPASLTDGVPATLLVVDGEPTLHWGQP